MYDEGISKEGDVLDLGTELGVAEKRGSYFSYKGERLAQGRENAKLVFREDPALCLEIENTIRRLTDVSDLEATLAPDVGSAAPISQVEGLPATDGPSPRAA